MNYAVPVEYERGRLLMKIKKAKFTEPEETEGPMEVVHCADKINAPQDTLEQFGDGQEVREPHYPATKIWGPPEERQTEEQQSKDEITG